MMNGLYKECFRVAGEVHIIREMKHSPAGYSVYIADSG